MVTRYDPKIHHRRSIRLKGYDYAQMGAYFVTICTYNGECLFGNVVDGNMDLNELGRMVQTIWNELPNYYESVALDDFVIMPNHIHGIIVLTPVGAQSTASPDPVGAQFIAPQAQFIAPSKSIAPPNPASVGAQFIAPQARFIAPSKSTAPLNAATGAINRARGVINHAPTVGEIVRGFKARCTHAVNKIRQTPGTPVWQRNYYEHIIRNEADYNRIAEYVATNPRRWMEDSLHPDNPIVEVTGRSHSRNTSIPGNRDE